MPLPKPPARKAAQLDASELGTPSLTRSGGNKASTTNAKVSSAAATAPATPATRSPRAAAGSPGVKATKSADAPASGAPDLQVAAAAASDTVAAALPASAPNTSPETGAAQERPATRSQHVSRPTSARSRKTKSSGPAKLFVLDTNVLMHDPMSLFRFEEHDVYLPMITLEELDGHKKGMSEVARNARQVSRELDALATDGSLDPKAGIPLAKTGRREAGGKLYFQTTFVEYKLPAGLPQGKADNQILGVVQTLMEQQPDREVVLVSKDINMRVKARALGLAAEDYFNDKALEDGDLLYTGVMALPADFWERHGKTMESWQQGGVTYYRISGPLVR
jgi:PhoH-like ATPase